MVTTKKSYLGYPIIIGSYNPKRLSMSKRAFGKHYYSMENSYFTKIEAERNAKKFRASGKYLVRVARTGWGSARKYRSFWQGEHQWAVYLRSK